MIKIRKLQRKDVPELVKIGSQIGEFKVTKTALFWSRAQLKALAKSRNDICLIAEEKGRIIGFVITTANRATGKVTLENSWIRPVYRNRHLGTSLTAHLLKKLKDKKYSYVVGFTMLPSSKLGFLKRNGFAIGEKGTWLDRIL